MYQLQCTAKCEDWHYISKIDKKNYFKLVVILGIRFIRNVSVSDGHGSDRDCRAVTPRYRRRARVDRASHGDSAVIQVASGRAAKFALASSAANGPTGRSTSRRLSAWVRVAGGCLVKTVTVLGYGPGNLTQSR